MQWGTKVRGPKLEVSADGLTIKDVATDPREGDDNLGRYRPCATNISLQEGVHRISIKIVRPGRINFGVCTSSVTSACRERTKNSIYQISQAWIICIPSKCDPNDMNVWHAGNSSKSGLPGLSVGGQLDMILDSVNGRLEFLVNDRPGNSGKSIFRVPVRVPLFPVVAFGGDRTKGAAVELIPAQVSIHKSFCTIAMPGNGAPLPR